MLSLGREGHDDMGAEKVDPIDTGIVDWIWDGQLQEMYGYTDSDLAILARLLLRPCRRCGAGPGDWCVTSAGRKIEHMDDQHIERRDLRPKPI